MNAVAKVRALIEPGATIEVVENTYIPGQAGTRRVVGKWVGREAYDCFGPHRAGQEPRDCRGAIPTRVKDVVSVDETSATFYLGRDEHTVTIRRVDG